MKRSRLIVLAVVVVLGIIIFLKTGPHRSPKAVVRAYLSSMVGDRHQYFTEDAELAMPCADCGPAPTITETHAMVLSAGVPEEHELSTTSACRCDLTVTVVVSWERHFAFCVERHWGRWYIAAMDALDDECDCCWARGCQ